MHRLREWFAAEREKMAGYGPLEIAGYIWEYYRLWLIGITAAVLFLGWMAVRLLTVPTDNWFFACFANTYAPLGNGSAFQGGFARYAGYDLAEKKLEFNAAIYCQPSGKTFGNSYYETLVSFLDSGELDVVVMEREDIEALGASGRLLDLEDERLNGLVERWADKLVWVEPLDGKTDKAQVAVGIDLAGSMLVGDHCAYPEGGVLGVSAQAGHLDQIEVFLQYLFEETMPS